MKSVLFALVALAVAGAMLDPFIVLAAEAFAYITETL